VTKTHEEDGGQRDSRGGDDAGTAGNKETPEIID